jgi:glycosyltransferase involved in cell wall biosynthesis
VQKVILIEPVLAHYRKDVFKSFIDCEDIDIEIIAGLEYEGIKSLESTKSQFKHIVFNLFGHTFYYLKGSVKYALSRKPDAIICTGADFHLLHSILIFFIFRIILRKKFYWWSHGTNGHQGKFGIFIRKVFYKSSSGIFAYNKAGKENLLKMGIPVQRIVVVNNSINREDYGYLNHDVHNKKENEVFTILYSGRVNKAKKVDILIKALGILKMQNIFPFKCFIVGDGDLDGISDLVKELKIASEVTFTGAKYGDEAHLFFLESDIFVYPGGIGLSALHSLSFGIPIITTDNLNLHFPEFELIQPGLNGDLFKDNSPENLADKLVEWRSILLSNRSVIIENCINQIIELEYLPDKVSSKALDFLRLELGIC